jgi:hypothetical protein
MKARNPETLNKIMKAFPGEMITQTKVEEFLARPEVRAERARREDSQGRQGPKESPGTRADRETLPLV